MIDGKPIRESANTRSWERAELKARTMGNVDAPPSPQSEPKITIDRAVNAFLEDERSRHLSKTTTGQSKTLLEGQLLKWARQQGLMRLDELTASLLSKFRATWTNVGNNANTARRKHQRLSGFLWFCVRNEWIEKNPAK
ncbi:MAG TPA: phage integrase SAM-like domain-containing protein, partial [Candidatus Angelobacter sp.]